LPEKASEVASPGYTTPKSSIILTSPAMITSTAIVHSKQQ
ncbi:18393_t:CDS:1, partial [Racocetra persica]